MPEVERFETCRSCRHPFPLFTLNGVVSTATRCPPCRKRARARSRGETPELSIADQAYDAIHGLYSLRDEAWRNRLDGLQVEVGRLSDTAGELSDENIGLRAHNARLLEENEELTERLVLHEDRTNDAGQVPGLKRQVMNLTERLNRVTASRNRIEGELRQAQKHIKNSVLSSIFGEPQRGVLDDLPEGVSVMDLVKLCHPDTHATKDTTTIKIANEVTKWLLTKRKQ